MKSSAFFGRCGDVFVIAENLLEKSGPLKGEEIRETLDESRAKTYLIPGPKNGLKREKIFQILGSVF